MLHFSNDKESTRKLNVSLAMLFSKYLYLISKTGFNEFQCILHDLGQLGVKWHDYNNINCIA